MLFMVVGSMKRGLNLAGGRPRACILTAAAGIAFALFPLRVQAVEKQVSAVIEDSTRSESGDGRRTLKQFPKNLLRGAGGVFSRENVHPLLGGALVTGLGLALDDDLRD